MNSLKGFEDAIGIEMEFFEFSYLTVSSTTE